jgi:large subunit ribosomal protein L20
MPRARPGAASHRRKVRLFREAKGFRGGRSKLFKTASEALLHAGTYAYRDRKARKREFRSLWIIRLAGACRERGLAYSRFICGLKQARVTINRKMLSELAIHDVAAFDKIVDIAKKHLAKAAA